MKQGLKILRALAKGKEPMSLPLIAETIQVSVPTVTRLMNDLKTAQLVIEEGKQATESGRKPMVYSIQKKRFYVLGVEILLDKIQASVIDINLDVVFSQNKPDFTLKNSSDCRTNICNFLRETIEAAEIASEHFIGIGIGITGRVNSATGKTYNFFENESQPFAKFLREELQLPVIVENDTRTVGIFELAAGKIKDARNALIINISSGIGMTLIANQQIITGESGFAGEFGHMQFAGNLGRSCICGKRGCLDTEVSGKALEVAFEEALGTGEKSQHLKNDTELHYKDIIRAANNGDLLSINLVQKQGERLGYALGNIINLLNPQVIVISGEYSRINGFFRSSVETGLYQTGLKNPIADCRIINSTLKTDSGCLGAATLVFKKHDLI